MAWYFSKPLQRPAPDNAAHHLLSIYGRNASTLMEVHSVSLGNGWFGNISRLNRGRVDNPP
jgi:hypothetical protein